MWLYLNTIVIFLLLGLQCYIFFDLQKKNSAKIYFRDLCRAMGTFVIYVAIIGPLLEEYLFRVLLCDIVTDRYYFNKIFPSVIFGVAHVDIDQLGCKFYQYLQKALILCIIGFLLSFHDIYHSVTIHIVMNICAISFSWYIGYKYCKREKLNRSADLKNVIFIKRRRSCSDVRKF